MLAPRLPKKNPQAIGALGGLCLGIKAAPAHWGCRGIGVHDGAASRLAGLHCKPLLPFGAMPLHVGMRRFWASDRRCLSFCTRGRVRTNLSGRRRVRPSFHARRFTDVLAWHRLAPARQPRAFLDCPAAMMTPRQISGMERSPSFTPSQLARKQQHVLLPLRRKACNFLFDCSCSRQTWFAASLVLSDVA